MSQSSRRSAAAALSSSSSRRADRSDSKRNSTAAAPASSSSSSRRGVTDDEEDDDSDIPSIIDTPAPPPPPPPAARTNKRPAADEAPRVSIPTNGWSGSAIGPGSKETKTPATSSSSSSSSGAAASYTSVNVGGKPWGDQNRKRPRLSIGALISGGDEPDSSDGKRPIVGVYPSLARAKFAVKKGVLQRKRLGIPGTSDPPIYYNKRTYGGGGEEMTNSAGPRNPDLGSSKVFPPLAPRQWQQDQTVITCLVEPNQMKKRDAQTEERSRMVPLGVEKDHICMQNEIAFVVNEARVTIMNPNPGDPTMVVTTSLNGLKRGDRIIPVGVINQTTKSNGYENSSVAVIIDGVVTIFNGGWCEINPGDYIAVSAGPFFVRIEKSGGSGYIIMPRYREGGISDTKFRPVIYVWSHKHDLSFKTSLTEYIRLRMDQQEAKMKLGEKLQGLRSEIDTWMRGKQFPEDHPGHILGYWIAMEELAEHIAVRLVYFVRDDVRYRECMEALRDLIGWVLQTETAIMFSDKEPEAVECLSDVDLSLTTSERTDRFRDVKRYITDRVSAAYTAYTDYTKKMIIGVAISTSPIGGPVDIKLGIKP